MPAEPGTGYLAGFCRTRRHPPGRDAGVAHRRPARLAVLARGRPGARTCTGQSGEKRRRKLCATAATPGGSPAQVTLLRLMRFRGLQDCIRHGGNHEPGSSDGQAARISGARRTTRSKREIAGTDWRARLVTGGLPPSGSGHEGQRCSCRAPPSAGSTGAAARKAGPPHLATRASPGTRGHTATSPGPCRQSPPAWPRFRSPSLSPGGPGYWA